MLYYKKKIEYSILDTFGILANQRTVDSSQGVGDGEGGPSLLPTLSFLPYLLTDTKVICQIGSSQVLE